MDSPNSKNKMKMSSGLERIVDFVGELAGFLTVALIVLMYANNMWNFIPANIASILSVVREWAILICVALLGLEFALNKGFFVFLIYAVLVAAAVIFLFFPQVWGMIGA